MIHNKQSFDDAISSVYGSTLKEFTRFSADKRFAKYVLLAATAPKPGFTIFYTPPAYQPPLLIVGMNPSNFAGEGASLKAAPNSEMLSGLPPTLNSYAVHNHVFAAALRKGFAGHEALFGFAVGMNVWFFQWADNANAAPRELKRFCQEQTIALVEIINPAAILCLSSIAFSTLINGAAEFRVANTRARYADVKGRRIWYSFHPTGSRSRLVGAADLPIVLADIEAHSVSMAIPSTK